MGIKKKVGSNSILTLGNCLEELKSLPDNCVDAIVTDPPYLIEFLAKKWDSEDGIAGKPEVWIECLRVLKHGGHLLSFGATRTYHRMTCAIEDAGFEIRDSIHWMYGSGFPHSLDVSKSIEGVLKGRGARYSGKDPNLETVLDKDTPGELWDTSARRTMKGQEAAWSGATITVTTEEAKRWIGWGTSLKPSHEPIVIARKPLMGNVAKNVQQYQTGALNIDASRVEGERWPPNVVFSHTENCVEGACGVACAVTELNKQNEGASSFFPAFRYQAKAPSKERKVEGLTVQHPTQKPIALMEWLVALVTPPNGVVLDPFMGSGTTGVAAIRKGFKFLGIEREEQYMQIAEARILSAKEE